jgi:Sec-independent protein secretion pathway component TatC
LLEPNGIPKPFVAPLIIIFSTLTARKIMSGAMIALSVFLLYDLGILIFNTKTLNLRK